MLYVYRVLNRKLYGSQVQMQLVATVSAFQLRGGIPNNGGPP